MKKIISVLVVLAMLMAMAPMVLAATESGGFMLEGGTDYTWTPEYSGTATLSAEPSVNIMVDGGNTAMGFNPTFDVVEGQSYTVRHFGTGFAWISWEIATAGGNDSGATSGTVVIESYSFGEFTAPQDGTVRLTLDVNSTMDVVVGFSPVALGLASGSTLEVTAGTTYSVYAPTATVNATLTWEYVAGGEGGEGGDQGGNLPAGNALALGSNTLAIEAGDADGETYTYTATETGDLAIEITGFAYDEGFGFGMNEVPLMYLGMVFSRNFVLEINGVAVYDLSAPTTVAVNAGDEVTVVFASPMMRYAAELTINLAMGSGNPGGDQGGESGEDLNAQYQGSGTMEDPFIIDSIPVNLGVTMTPMANDLYFQYTVVEGGVISFGTTEATVWPIVNGNWNFSSDPVEVAAGDVVVFNIFGAYTNVYVPIEFEAGATLGGGSSNTPTGDINSEFVIETLAGGYTVTAGPTLDKWDVYYKYEVEQDGTIECTSEEGGSFYFSVNDPSGYDWGSPATSIDVVVGDVLYINYYNTTGNDISGTVAYAQSAPAGESVASGTESVTATGSVDIFFTPDANGILSVTISADPGYKIWVFNAATDESIGLPESGATGAHTYELEAGVAYRIQIIGYADWSEAAATITYDISFASAQIAPDMIEIEKSNVVLELGENNVDLLENTIVSLFDFVPAEAGTYKFTVPAGVTLAQYGYAAWNLMETAENGVLEVVATAAEQTIMIGLSGDVSSVNVIIEKTADYVAPQETIYQNYTQTTPVDSNFEMPQGEFVSIDITQKQTIVLGNDGYYHLGSFDGPVILVNLNSDGFTLATLYGAGAPITMRGEKYTGEDGKTYCYDYMSFITGGYYDYSRVNDYHPLNADLMAFFQDYGTAQGWYMQGLSGFAAINAGGFNEESAWMVAMGTVAGFNGSATDPDAGNQGGNTDNQGGNTDNQGGNTGNQGGNTGNQGGNTGSTNPAGGDFGVVAAAIAMGMSAICGTAVIVKKKKEN